MITYLGVAAFLFVLFQLGGTAGPVILQPQTTQVQLIWVVVGLFGILANLLVSTSQKVGNGIDSIGVYVKAHTIPLILNVIFYFFLVALWVSTGLEFLGLYQGQLNALTFGIGFSGNDLARAFMKSRIEDNIKKLNKTEGGT